jgi:hypothetical protein
MDTSKQPPLPPAEGKELIEIQNPARKATVCFLYPTDPALLLLRTRGYGVTAPRRSPSEDFSVGLIVRANGPRMSSVDRRNINNKPASRSRQAPLFEGFWRFGVC